MLKKLSVISEGYRFNADIHSKDIALIDIQSFRGDDDVDVAEIVVSKAELLEIIRMLEHASALMK